jgi:L-threonylcarbamoyladenylate synthase
MIVAPSPQAIARAAELLADGALVAFPTETVYGLGADARSDAALERLYRVKGRPGEHPVIVHIASAAALPDWSCDVPDYAMVLAHAFWPGPLTLVLPHAAGVSARVTGGQDSIGLRVPAHPVAQALLESFARHGGDGIAAPSANRFGRISATRAQHVEDEFGADVALILDGGPCDHGIESTIVDCTGAKATLLRPGAITGATLAATLGAIAEVAGRGSPRVSGSLAAHYAPSTPSRLLPAAELAATLAAFAPSDSTTIGVLARTVTRPDSFRGIWRAMPSDSIAYSYDLYAALRELDAANTAAILIEAPPAEDSWAAVADRLQRATHRA